MIINRYLVFALISLIISFRSQSNSEDKIIELSDETVNDFLSINENVLLEFYIEGCQHCEEFAPTFLEIAEKVSGMNVKLAKIDGNINKQSSTDFDIQNFPTIKLIQMRKNAKFEYKGEKTADLIIDYLNTKINREASPIRDLEHLNQLEKVKKVLIVFGAANTTYPDIFTQVNEVVSRNEDLNLFYTNNSDVLNIFGCSSNYKPAILIVKKFDEGTLKYDYEGILNRTHFEEWISLYTSPVVLEISNEVIKKSIAEQLPSVFLVIGNSSVLSNQMEKLFYKYGKLNRRNILFVKGQTGNEMSDKLLEYFQVQLNKTPVIFGYFPQFDNSVSKHKFTLEFNEVNFELWLKDFIDRKLPKYYASEPIPVDPIHEGVPVVVGNSFHDLVLNNTNDVLLELYAQWCEKCKQLAPKIVRLNQKLKNNSNIFIAKLDGALNEYEGLDPENFPLIIFFKGGDQTPEEKFKNRKLYEEKKNVATLIEFLKNNTFHAIKDILKLENEDQIEEQEKNEEEDEEDNEGGDHNDVDVSNQDINDNDINNQDDNDDQDDHDDDQDLENPQNQGEDEKFGEQDDLNPENLKMEEEKESNFHIKEDI